MGDNHHLPQGRHCIRLCIPWDSILGGPSATNPIAHLSLHGSSLQGDTIRDKNTQPNGRPILDMLVVYDIHGPLLPDWENLSLHGPGEPKVYSTFLPGDSKPIIFWILAAIHATSPARYVLRSLSSTLQMPLTWDDQEQRI